MDISEVNWSGEFDGETFELPVNNSYVVGCHWRCEGDAKYVLLFLHGLNNCVSFNCNFLREVPKHGGSAIASDHIGSGKSPGVNQYTSIEEICEETRQMIRYARVVYGDRVPIFLMGHSLGGLATLRFCLSHVTEVNMLSGVIAHAPWLDTGNPDMLLDAANFVATCEKRQGLYISCIEEIAYKKGFIGRDQLLALAEPLKKTNYGKYLIDVANGL